MRKRSLVLFVTIFLLGLSTGNAFASGGDDSDDTQNGLDLSSYERNEVVVDPSYETGKSIYTGRKKGVTKLSYCLLSGEQPVALKRKTIKVFKQTTYSKLSVKLVNCDKPSMRIRDELEQKDFLTVLYYLDKRYKLALEPR